MQRYRATTGHDTAAMVSDPAGPWIVGDEAEAEIARLQRELEEARKQGADCCLGEACDDLREAESKLSEALTRIETLYDAVKYILCRTQIDPDQRWACGWGSEAFHRLCVAEAAYLGRPLEEIERERQKDLQPDYRRKDPEVLVLRQRIEELERG